MDTQNSTFPDIPSLLAFALKGSDEEPPKHYIVKYVEYTPILFVGQFLVTVLPGQNLDEIIDQTLKAVRHSKDDGQLTSDGKHAFRKDGYSICASMVNELSRLEYAVLSKYIGLV